MKANERISVIIPARNEEACLQRTLEAIQSQKEHSGLEIIVSISPDTKDNTKIIAERYGCRTVTGGRPATAKNNGARVAAYDILFFLDADTHPEERNFLSTALKEFEERGLDLAGTLLDHDYNGNSVKKTLYKYMFKILNTIFLKREYTRKPKMGTGVFARKDVFLSLEGFDEGIFGEDSELAERAIRHHPCFNFGILKQPAPLKTSVRRFEEEGILGFLLKVGYLNAKAELLGYKSLQGAINSYFNGKSK
jgi:cellulose synthase/poly-beta-1,6-N-acetylglucosamine synthase-like glycosyltransferase